MESYFLTIFSHVENREIIVAFQFSVHFQFLGVAKFNSATYQILIKPKFSKRKSVYNLARH